MLDLPRRASRAPSTCVLSLGAIVTAIFLFLGGITAWGFRLIVSSFAVTGLALLAFSGLLIVLKLIR